jgi:Protein of unknown function (DUF2778)
LEHFRENYYRLDPIDKKPRNDWNERLDRGNFRLHPGRISEGCITLDDDYENPNEIWKKRQFKSEVQQVLMAEDKILRKAFDSQGIF